MVNSLGSPSIVKKKCLGTVISTSNSVFHIKNPPSDSSQKQEFAIFEINLHFSHQPLELMEKIYLPSPLINKACEAVPVL